MAVTNHLEKLVTDATRTAGRLADSIDLVNYEQACDVHVDCPTHRLDFPLGAIMPFPPLQSFGRTGSGQCEARASANEDAAGRNNPRHLLHSCRFQPHPQRPKGSCRRLWPTFTASSMSAVWITSPAIGGRRDRRYSSVDLENLPSSVSSRCAFQPRSRPSMAARKSAVVTVWVSFVSRKAANRSIAISGSALRLGRTPHAPREAMSSRKRFRRGIGVADHR